jgi:histidyl-tRNA synthetase
VFKISKINKIKVKKKVVKVIKARAQIDEIMKFLFGVSKQTLLNMLSSLFKQNFSIEDSEIVQTNSEFVDENFDITRGDLFFLVADKTKKHNLHIELQTRADGHLVIRILEYDIKKADEIQRLENKSGIKRYILPKSIVIHVEKSKSIPEFYEFEIVDIKDNGSEEIIHRIVPVIKYWELTDKELIERKLYPLLPLQIFLLRDKLKNFSKERDAEDKKKVIQEIKDLTEKIIDEVKKLVDENKIVQDDADRIITALNKLIKYLNKKYNFDESLNQEVDTMIESVFTKLKREGKEEVAQEMILNDEPLEKIIKYSKLTEKKIRELAAKLSKELIINVPIQE